MSTHMHEKGQALVLITLAAVGLFGFAALAIDGSRIYSDRRHAQNAADTAGLAAGLAYTRAEADDVENDTDIQDLLEAAAGPIAAENGYDGVTRNTVTISFVHTTECTTGEGIDITVNIISELDMTLARVIGRTDFRNNVTSITRACRPDPLDILKGNAIVALNPATEDCGLDSWNADWDISGGGVYSNGCAISHKGFILDEGKCVTTSEDAPPAEGDFPEDVCTETTSKTLSLALMNTITPRNPCTGADPGPGGQYDGGGIKAYDGQLTFENNIYCLADIDYMDNESVRLNKATLYVTDLDFDLQFAGGTGGFSGTATKAGDYDGSAEYAGYFMIITPIPPPGSPCVDYQNDPQTMTLRGNLGEDITGTFFAPTSCIDMNGTTDGQMKGQIIAYSVTSSGDVTIDLDYDPNANPFKPVDGNLSIRE